MEVELRVIPTSARSIFAVVCALALAGILISPAVPSPPTVVGKAMHAFFTSLVLAVLPPACALGTMVLGVLYLTVGGLAGAGGSAAASAFFPLRR